MTESGWFPVVGGPPPAEIVFRDTLLALSVPLGLVVLGLWLPLGPRLVCMALAAGLGGGLGLFLRRRWQRRQAIRVVGNVLEHRDGDRVVRLALTRALVSTAAAPHGVLVLVVDDGHTHLAIGRRAEPHEISDLPPRLGPYLELAPADFEEVRIAAHRSYPQA
ncbi:MAG: hypothetical protein RMK29_11350 [Myxococcales bacterium]|nr:hypothetical protein [Myxococcota bacterium]MDW8282303.1 hypothetical protein [Myxococcales bacterium]